MHHFSCVSLICYFLSVSLPSGLQVRDLFLLVASLLFGLQASCLCDMFSYVGFCAFWAPGPLACFLYFFSFLCVCVGFPGPSSLYSCLFFSFLYLCWPSGLFFCILVLLDVSLPLGLQVRCMCIIFPVLRFFAFWAPGPVSL